MRKYGLQKLTAPDHEKSRAQKTVALSLASMFGSLLSLVLSMIMARVLSKTELAAYNQTFMVLTTLSPFLLLGIPSGIYYVLTRNEGRTRAVVHEAVLCVLGSCTVFALFLLLGGSSFLGRAFQNGQLRGYLYWLIPCAVFSVLFSVAMTVYVYYDRVSLSAKLNVINTIFTAVCVIVAVLLCGTAFSGIAAHVAATVLVGAAAIVLLFCYIVPADDGRIRGDSIRQLLKISVPLGLASMVGTLDSYLDKWIVSAMLSPETYAVFANGAHEIPFIGAITGAITTVILVDMTRACKDGDYAQALQLFRGAAEKTSMILLPIMMLLLVLSEPLIAFLYTDAYLGAVNVFRVYVLFLPMRTVFYGSIMTALGKAHAVLTRAVAALAANAVCSVLFVHLFGAIGASLATILAAYCVNLPINFYVICKTLHIPWTQLLPLKHYGMCLLLSLPGTLLCWLCSYLLRDFGAFWRLAAGGCAFAAVTVPIFIRYFHLPWRELLRKLKGKLGN